MALGLTKGEVSMFNDSFTFFFLSQYSFCFFPIMNRRVKTLDSKSLYSKWIKWGVAYLGGPSALEAEGRDTVDGRWVVGRRLGFPWWSGHKHFVVLFLPHPPCFLFLSLAHLLVYLVFGKLFNFSQFQFLIMKSQCTVSWVSNAISCFVNSKVQL